MDREESKKHKLLKNNLFSSRPANSFSIKGHLTTLQKNCSINKVPFTTEFVKSFLEDNRNNDRKVIIFAHFIESQHLLIERFKDISVSILGGDSDQKREEARERFNNDPNIRIFIISTLAGGVGLNLVAADTVIFNDLLWTPTDHKQAEDRINRIGQKNTCFIYYTIFRDSIEEAIWNTLERKFNLISQTLGDIDLDEDNVVKNILDAVLVSTKK